MKTKLGKFLTKLSALVIILTLMPSGLGMATSGSRPEVAVPFEDELTSGEDAQISLLVAEVNALVSGAVFQNGGDRLAYLQNTDGSWDWPLDDGNPASASPPNTIGPIGQGLAEAYVHTSDPDHLAALQLAGTFLLAKTNNFSPSDGYLAVTLDEILGGTTYSDHVMTNFYGPLAADSYNRNGAGTLYDTAEYVNLIRTTRASQGIPNLAAWDISLGLVGAAAVGADTSAWIAGVKAEIDELDGGAYYDVIGLAGAVFGLAYVGEDHDPQSGEHASASSLADLGTILAGYQLNTGGFTWNSGALGEGVDNETIQETAYAVLALDELNRSTYLNIIQAAANYMESVQLGTGGWRNWVGDGENNEITGEALWGIATVYPPNQPPIAEANGPYSGDEGSPINLDGTGSSDLDGDPLSYSWSVNTPLCTFGDATSATPELTCTDSGSFNAILTVDDGQVTDSDTANVTVNNVAPSVSIDSVSPTLIAVGESVTAIGSFTDPGTNDTHTAEWDWGDSTTSGTLSGLNVGPDSHTYTAPGIYTLKLTVTDYDGGEGSATFEYIVVYDPDGGFVTGGGWIDSPPGAYKGHEFDIPTLVWDKDFSLDDTGWLDDDDAWYGDITVSGGTATFYGDVDSAPFSRFDGYRDVWPGTWTAEIDVYLDPSWPSGQGFDYSVAANGSDGEHQRDYIFHVGVVEDYGPITGKALLVNGSNNADFDTNPYKLVNDNGGNYYTVDTAGWYTLQHVFYDAGGYLAVDLNLVDSNGATLWTATRENVADTITGEVGGNRYAWFTHIDVANGIQVDNHQLFIPVSPTGKATFGFVSKYKKGANVPTGNTEFQFKAGDLNFHSTSYDWLVVTGSNYAKFKGVGTINGAGEYKFQIWAGDNDPDTFRVKIWYEDGGSEVVVYDNGMDQEIGGGSIVVHTKK